MSRAARRLAVAAAVALALGGGARELRGQPLPCSGPNRVVHSFGPGQAAWGVCWYDFGIKGLAITAAFLRKPGSNAWVRVVWKLDIAEIFVPYHTGQPRFYDLQWGYLNTLTAQDCPPPQGVLLGPATAPPPPQPPYPHVCREIRDRDLAWRDHQGVRRGQELVLWGSYDAGNYKYIMRYGFQDDGVITARMGSTGLNSPGVPWEGHMHNALFRADLDLVSFPQDRVKLVLHSEPTGSFTATDTEQLIPTETGLVWDDQAFTGLRIEDAVLQNSRGHTSGYTLVPIRTGTARHFETWTHYDMWVTRYHPSETSWNLPAYVQNQQSVNNTDIVVWYWGSSHHHPRDEDGQVTGNTFTGVAQVMWTGFMLIPHNWLDGPPLWP